MNSAIVGNKYIVKGFHKTSIRFQDSQHWVGKVVECIFSDGEGVSGGDPDNTCACKIKNIETKEEIYSCAVYLEEYKMNKLITEPIDFTGCIPEVAEALKRGLKVKTDLGWINAYTDEEYCIFDEDSYYGWTYVRVKKASEIVKWLEDNNYKADKDGDWVNSDKSWFFSAKMFLYCNKIPNKHYKWLPEWLEEVEV